MKYCKLPFEGLYVYPNGDVRVCGWTYECIGNILEEDFDSIWHGEKAEKIRDAIRDGSFRLCNKVACQYCANESYEELTDEEFEKRAVVSDKPKVIDAAYDYICNHSCPSCRHGIFKPDSEYVEKITKIQEILLPILNQAESVMINGNGDLFASQYMMKMMKEFKPSNQNAEIIIQTNGVLFNEKTWEKIKHLSKYNLKFIVTPNSYEKETFKYISGGHDNVDKLIDSLYFIKKLRKSGEINHLDISIVVQDRNYRELPAFVKRSIEEFECDRVVIKPIFYWFSLTPEEYWFKDVLNPKHPYFNEYMEILNDPILKHPKVYFWGGDEIHEEKEHPAYSYKTYFDGFYKIWKHKNPKEKLESEMLKKGMDKVAIYGTNDMSEMLYNLLEDTKINVISIVARDMDTDVLCGQKVHNLEEFDVDSVEYIIVSNYAYIKNIERDLRFHGYKGKLIPYCDLLD